MQLITSNLLTKDLIGFAETAEALGWTIYKANWGIPDDQLRKLQASRSESVVCGSRMFCEIISTQMELELAANPPDWVAKLPKDYTQRNIEIMSVSDARNLTSEKFVKAIDPISGFYTKIYASGAAIPRYVEPETLLMVSDVMKFTSQYRCFVKDKRVITACCYLYKDIKWTDPVINNTDYYLINNDAIIEFVNGMLQDPRVNCVNGTVIDVGRFKKDTYAVINTKQACVSELYGCERVAALDTLATSCNAVKQ